MNDKKSSCYDVTNTRVHIFFLDKRDLLEMKLNEEFNTQTNKKLFEKRIFNSFDHIGSVFFCSFGHCKSRCLQAQSKQNNSTFI